MMNKSLKFKRNTVSLALAGTVILGTIAGVRIGMNANSNSYWTKSNGYWYYIENGNKKTGWLNDNGTWYYLKEDGTMATGWILDKGNWYYFYSNGSMAHDTTIDGYYLNSSGAWTTNTTSSSSSTGGVRTGAELLPKLYDLGFFDAYSDAECNMVKYNPYGKNGLNTFDSIKVYAYNSGDNDIVINVFKKNSDTNEKLKTILDMITSKNSENLYSMFMSDTSGTLNINGRNVQIITYSDYTSIIFKYK